MGTTSNSLIIALTILSKLPTSLDQKCIIVGDDTEYEKLNLHYTKLKSSKKMSYCEILKNLETLSPRFVEGSPI